MLNTTANVNLKSGIALVFLALTLNMAQAQAESMPPDVVARVKENLTSIFPDNYSMQKLMLDDEKQSYKFLSTYAPASVPAEVLQKIKDDMAGTFPDNYSMQKLMIVDQVKSFRELNK